MSKIVRYDENGKEVYFDYGIDAREAVASGRFFETPPEGTVAKKTVEAAPEMAKKTVEAAPEVAKKKGRPVKAEESAVPEAVLDAEDAEIAETVLEDVIAEEAQVADAKE